MKKIKRILSAVLAAAMITASASFVSAAQVAFTDTSGHWAWDRGYIPYLVEKDVLNGYKQSNGTYMFKPDGTVTRAEFIKMLDETFGLTETTSIRYNDVSTSDWFYEYFAKAAAQGYILNYGQNANPNGALSREEATSLLVRYLNLPDDVKAPATTFTDYEQISSFYRDNVLKATATGLIYGYKESNGTYTFRPQNTLTRAEALTILYRAAGSIFTANASSRESGAFEENAVIKNGDITLQNLTLDGRVIVSEGADEGTVGFYQSKINDTLYIRGDANITIADTKANTVVVESKDAVSISVIDGTTIDNLIINAKCSVTLGAGTIVKNLTVNSAANLTSVTGSGTIQNAYIAADNFTSSIIPQEFEIATGLTATFASVSYQGSSSSQESFNNTPFVTVDDDMFCLNVLSLADGTVRYYYTNSSYCPNISNFDSYYSKATYRNSFKVTANKSITEKTYSTSTVKTYGYVVLQLQSSGRYYPPVIIPNTDTSGTGFTVNPYLYTETSIRFTTSTSGTVYYMYSDVGTQMNINDFIVAYSEQSKELKGDAQGSSLRATTVAVNAKYAAVNRYMILMFKTTSGLYYTPVVVPLGNNGFSASPSVTTPGTIDFTTSVSGTLYYYYSATNDLPSPDKFNAAYRDAEYSDKVDVTKNKSNSIAYKTRYADDYPYIIMCIRDTSSNYMQPVSVSINYDPGFDVLPEVTDDSTIRFKPSYDGKVYYYYTKESKAPSAKDFDENYDNAQSRYKDFVEVSDGNYTKIKYDATKAATYPYMAIMLTDDDNKSYQPVVVSLKTTSNTGFTITPYAYDGEIFFKTNYDCEVWWFYAKTEQSVSASEFYDEWDDSTYGSSTTVKGGVLSSFEYRKTLIEDYPYIVIATSADSDSEIFTYPIVLNVTESASQADGSGIKVTRIDNDTIYVTAYEEGTIYYYETDNAKAPSTKDFEYEYMKAGTRDRVSASSGEEGIEIPYSGKYDYVMIQLAGEDSRGNELLYSVVSVNTDDKTASEDDENTDGATEGGYGFELKKMDPRNRTVTIVSEKSGSVQVSLATVNYGTVFSTNTYTVKADEEVEISYPSTGVIGGLELYLFLQFTDDSGNVYQRYGGIELLDD